MKSVEKLASVVLSSCHVLEVLRCTYKAFVLCYLLEFSKPLCLTITKQSRNTTTSQESRKQKHHKAKQEHHSFTGTWQTKKHCSTGSALHCFVEPLGIPQSRTIYIYIRQERFRVQLQFQLYLSLEYFLTLSALKPWRQEEVGSNSGWFLLQNHL